MTSATNLSDSSPCPLAIVSGQTIQARNARWSSEIGLEPSLPACFMTEDREAVLSALERTCDGPASFVARLTVGPRRGEALGWTAWPSGGGTRGLRLDGPAPAAEEPITHSKAKALLWMFDRMEAALWAIRRDGVITLSEGAALARYGLRSGQLVGCDAREIYPAESKSAELTRRTLAGESVQDGYAEDDFYWMTHSYPLRGPDGEVEAQIGLTLTVPESTREFKHAQELMSIVNKLPMIVWAMARDGTCTLCAGNGLAKLGIAHGEFRGRNLFDHFAGSPDILEDMKRALAGEPHTVERPIGDMIWRTIYHCARDGAGNVTGLFAVSEDVTARANDEQRMREQLAVIQSQKEAIDRLISPIIEVWSGVLVVPLIGNIGAERAPAVTEKLLDRVVQKAARFAILDLTGIELVDTRTARHLFDIMRGVDLLGATALISGIQPSVASTMVSLGVEIPSGRTYPTLAEALRRCVQSM